MNKERTQPARLSDAVRLALTTGIGFTIAVAEGVVAQDAAGTADDVAVQQKVTVTGSRIKRLDYETALPVTVIDREAIDRSGDLTVADVVRRTTYNSFGSVRQRSGSSAQSVNAVNLRGLGEDKTLVLLNGRRLAGAPTEAGSIQNLSVIPLAAVERVEILRDGASAIYGTDAIAGVINIILRQDYEGVHLTADVGRPTASGGDEEAYSIVGGVTGAKGNITFAFDKQERDIVFEAERSFSQTGLSSAGFPASYFAFLTTDDPRNPTGGFLPLAPFPDNRCPESLGGDPDFPNSRRLTFGAPDGRGFCQYNFSSVSAVEAENDTKSFFVSANYEITETTSFFAQGTFAYNESFGRYAPSPVFGLDWSKDDPNNPTNPANPTNADGVPFLGQEIAVDADFDGVPDFTVEGPFDLSVRYRNAPTGPRDSNVEDQLLDYVAGLQGTVDWLGGADWELAGQYSEQLSDNDGEGFVLASELGAAIENGTLDIFGVADASLANIEAQAGGVSFTQNRSTRFRIAGADGQLGFDVFQLDPGPVSVAVGFEYRDEDFEEQIDEQTQAGNTAGGGGQVRPTPGARVVKSLFAETVIPVLDSLELNAAVRYDDYNDFGTTFNPKVGVAFRPLDSLLVRASWGQGFQAPSLPDLYTAIRANEGFGVIDTWRCSQTPQDTDGDGRANVPIDDLPPGHPCSDQFGSNPYTGLEGGNRDLNPTESTQWSLGFVWNPADRLSIGLDYYNIDIDQEVDQLPYQLKLDEEFRLRQAGATGDRVGDVTRATGGRLQTIENRVVNVATKETEGLDLDLRWGLTMGRFGDLDTRLYWTRVLNFAESDPQDPDRKVHRDGDLLSPEDRGQLTLSWALGDFTATIVGNYISDQEGHPVFCAPEDRCRLGVYTPVDVQASWATPWNGQITIGARNVFDDAPPQSDGFYSNYQHDVFGRVPYIRWEQDL